MPKVLQSYLVTRDLPSTRTDLISRFFTIALELFSEYILCSNGEASGTLLEGSRDPSMLKSDRTRQKD